MKAKNGWLWLVALLLLLICIFYGGPLLSSYIDKKHRNKIEKNGKITRAIVFLKKTHKGNTVHFQYYYKNKLYKNNEQNDSFFNELNIGDSIYILIDSTSPSSSYILE